jgi:hypothetical protein
MPEFAGFHAGLCRTLLTRMSEFAEVDHAFLPSSLTAAGRIRYAAVGLLFV